MNFHIITLFPDAISAYTSESILKRAQESRRISIYTYNPIDFIKKDSSTGKTIKRVDDKPYGGGPGMVVRAEPVMRAIQKAIGKKKYVEIIHFAPRGEVFTTAIAKQYAKKHAHKKIKDIVLICGRYEGIDSRIEEIYKGKKFSIGDYVLTGGELPALVLIDAISRQIPGVLGDPESREEERIASTKYYTRPEVLTHKKKHYSVPDVLLSGNHKEIDEWRKNN